MKKTAVRGSVGPRSPAFPIAIRPLSGEARRAAELPSGVRPRQPTVGAVLEVVQLLALALRCAPRTREEAVAAGRVGAPVVTGATVTPSKAAAPAT